MLASCYCFQSDDALCSSPQDAPALGRNQGCAAKEKILILAFPSTALDICLRLIFWDLKEPTEEQRSSLWSNTLLSFLSHVLHQGVANSLSLELGQQLTAKVHYHQFYGQTLAKAERNTMPACFTDILSGTQVQTADIDTCI